MFPYTEKIDIDARPFLKWAGGKTQLLKEIIRRLPGKIRGDRRIRNYVEPFVGGGAVFFHLLSNYKVDKATILDVNPELIVTYRVVKNDVNELIKKLKKIENEYLPKDQELRKEIYYSIRYDLNKELPSFDFHNYSESWIKRAAYLIFLNKTCFNGLFRQNSKGEFNVPMGSYKRPNICDKENLHMAHRALKDTEIIQGDFTEAEKYIGSSTLVYLDPPYRPLNATSNFNGYSKNGFSDEDQKRLALFFREFAGKGGYLILSNSDPKNYDAEDDFFDDLYNGFYIERVKATRMINCKGEKRGEINELIINNYLKGVSNGR